MKTVFITRNLKENSSFKAILKDAGFEVSGQSLIEFSPVSFQEIPKVDWIFFYSKIGVQYFFKEVEKGALKIPDNIKWATIGEKTASSLQSTFQKPDFVGNGNPKQTAKAFIKIAKGKNVLFPRAEKSLKSIQQLIEKEVHIHDLIVYKNEKKQKIEPILSDIVAFTSPMNVRAYFESIGAQTKQEFFVIGQTTAKALFEQGIRTFHVAPAPSEKSLAEIIVKRVNSEG